MDLISRMEGYTNQQIVYCNPVSYTTPLKTLHDKQDTTLLEMALKSFLKQRLYGRFQIFNKANAHNKNHLAFLDKVNDQRQRSSTSFENQYHQSSDNQNKKQFLNSSILSKRMLQSNKKQQNKNQVSQSRKLLTKSQYKNAKIGFLSTSLDMKISSNKKIAHSSFYKSTEKLNILSERKKSQIQHIKKDASDDFYGNSFISEIISTQKIGSLTERYSQNLKLPEITSKFKRQRSYLRQKQNQNIKNQPSRQIKQQSKTIVISQQFWQIVSKNRSQKRKKQQNVKQIESFRSSLNFSFNKQTFQKILTNEVYSIPIFTSAIYSFFQLNHRISDKMKKFQVENILSQIYNLDNRNWSVAIFRFLDINRDGRIDCSDLFKIYNYLDTIKSKVEQQFNSKLLQSTFDPSQLKQESQKQTKNILDKKIIRQKTQKTQFTVSNKFQKDKNETKNKLTSALSSKNEALYLENEIHFSSLRILQKKNIQNVLKLQEQIQKFNINVIQKRKSHNLSIQSLNPEYQTEKDINQKKQLQKQSTYLQEAVLKNSDLKFTDLSLILNQSSKDNNKTKKKVIEIDHKKLNIKLSSTYVQSFAATDHNEQTRLNREYIQTLKDYLQNENHQFKTFTNDIERKTFASIKYAEFYEKGLYIPLKTVFFSFFHAQNLRLN